MSPVRQLIYWCASIDWTPEAITAASTAALAFLTLILAVGTLFLWLATNRLVRGAEKTAERQLRAYVINWRAIISNVVAREIPEVEIEVKNFGQTPAYRVRHVARITLAIFPLTEDLALPQPCRKQQLGQVPFFSSGRDCPSLWAPIILMGSRAVSWQFMLLGRSDMWMPLHKNG